MNSNEIDPDVFTVTLELESGNDSIECEKDMLIENIIESLRTERDKAIEDVDNILKKLSASKDNNAKLVAEKAILYAKVGSLTTKLNELQAQLDSSIKDIESASELEQANTYLAEQLQHLDEYKHQAEKVPNLESHVDKLRDKLATSEQLLTYSEGKVSTLEQSIELMERQQDEITSQRDLMEVRAEKAEKLLSQLQDQVNGQDKLIKNKVATNDAIWHTRINEANERTKTVEKEKSTLETALKTANREIRRLKNNVDNAIKAGANELATHKNEISRLRYENRYQAIAMKAADRIDGQTCLEFEEGGLSVLSFLSSANTVKSDAGTPIDHSSPICLWLDRHGYGTVVMVGRDRDEEGKTIIVTPVEDGDVGERYLPPRKHWDEIGEFIKSIDNDAANSMIQLAHIRAEHMAKHTETIMNDFDRKSGLTGGKLTPVRRPTSTFKPEPKPSNQARAKARANRKKKK